MIKMVNCNAGEEIKERTDKERYISLKVLKFRKDWVTGMDKSLPQHYIRNAKISTSQLV